MCIGVLEPIGGQEKAPNPGAVFQVVVTKLDNGQVHLRGPLDQKNQVIEALKRAIELTEKFDPSRTVVVLEGKAAQNRGGVIVDVSGRPAVPA